MYVPDQLKNNLLTLSKWSNHRNDSWKLSGPDEPIDMIRNKAVQGLLAFRSDLLDKDNAYLIENALCIAETIALFQYMSHIELDDGRSINAAFLWMAENNDLDKVYNYVDEIAVHKINASDTFIVQPKQALESVVTSYCLKNPIEYSFYEQWREYLPIPNTVSTDMLNKYLEQEDSYSWRTVSKMPVEDIIRQSRNHFIVQTVMEYLLNDYQYSWMDSGEKEVYDTVLALLQRRTFIYSLLSYAEQLDELSIFTSDSLYAFMHEFVGSQITRDSIWEIK